MKLTEKQKAFYDCYIVSLNATESYKIYLLKKLMLKVM
ncbi:terminase small subunit [Terrisporobacter glycolicus]|nr:terminase small subunit [Terrisporobacter glycolicus]